MDIAQILKDKNITVKEMSNDLGMSRQHLYNKLKGINSWSFKDIVIISEKTKIPLNDFKGITLNQKF